MKLPTPRQLDSGNWFVRVRVGGQDLTHLAETQEECVTWATAVKSNYRLTHERIQPEAGEKTIRRLLKEYVAQSNFSRNTVQIYDALMANHFRTIMDTPFNKIVNWQRVLDGENLAPSTMHLYWTKIAAAINSAGLDVPKVRTPKAKPKRKEYLTPSEVQRFVECIKGNKYEICFLLMLSSCRISEALNVLGTDVTAKGVHIRGTKTPASDRIVPWMIPRLNELLEPLKGQKTPVCPYSNSAIRKALERVCEQNDFPHLLPHSLRKSFASLCWSLKVPERICMVIGGWSSLNVMHQVYIEISDDQVSEYAESIANFIAKKQ